MQGPCRMLAVGVGDRYQNHKYPEDLQAMSISWHSAINRKIWSLRPQLPRSEGLTPKTVGNPSAPSIDIILKLGPTVYEYDLLWAMWRFRVVGAQGGSESLEKCLLRGSDPEAVLAHRRGGPQQCGFCVAISKATSIHTYHISIYLSVCLSIYQSIHLCASIYSHPGVDRIPGFSKTKKVIFQTHR